MIENVVDKKTIKQMFLLWKYAWHSRKQNAIALLIVEAEYIGAGT